MRSILVTSAVLAALAAAAPAARADGPEVVAPAKSEGVVFETGTPKFEDVLAKAKAEKKPVFVDFSTEWCGWCRKLEKETFSQASVADVMKALINVHVDAEKGEGPDLAKRYGVHGFPTLVVVDADGAEIDRIVGYRPPAKFQAEIERMLRGEGTVPALKKQWTDSPGDAAAGLAYADKIGASDPAAAADVCEKLLASDAVKDRETQAKVRLEYATALLSSRKADAGMAEAERLVKEFADTPAGAEAGPRLGRAFVGGDAKRALAFLDAARAATKNGEDLLQIEELTVAVHKNGIAASLKRQAAAAGDDPQMLNAVAWTCFEEKVNVREALGWAKTAVEKSNRDPAILDTLANLLWISGQHSEAIETETEAAKKVADPKAAAMKAEFEGNIAKWRAQEAAMKAVKAGKGAEKDDDDEDDDDEMEGK
jgi:thioredoxin-like negative regulator of GroEL